MKSYFLLRVAERPISDDPNVIKAPVFDPRTQTMEVLTFHRDDPDYDFDDPRMIRKKTSWIVLSI